MKSLTEELMERLEEMLARDSIRSRCPAGEAPRYLYDTGPGVGNGSTWCIICRSIMEADSLCPCIEHGTETRRIALEKVREYHENKESFIKKIGEEALTAEA